MGGGGRGGEGSWGTGSGMCSHVGSAGRGKLLREETHGKEGRGQILKGPLCLRGN